MSSETQQAIGQGTHILAEISDWEQLGDSLGELRLDVDDFTADAEFPERLRRVLYGELALRVDEHQVGGRESALGDECEYGLKRRERRYVVLAVAPSSFRRITVSQRYTC